MLTRAAKHALPDLAAQVSTLHPGASLDLVDGDAVLTFAAAVGAEEQQQVRRLVAGTLHDFRIVTPDDPPAATTTEAWLAEHGRSSHHLTDALASFR